jgi:ATP-binding cassette subfamily C protein LapB
MAESKPNPSARAWLEDIVNPLRPVFRGVLVISLFVNLLALAVPIFTMQVYDRVVTHHGIGTLFGLVIGMLLIIVFDFILRQTRSRIMQTVALRVDVLVGKRLFDKLMALPLQTLEARPGSY